MYISRVTGTDIKLDQKNLISFLLNEMLRKKCFTVYEVNLEIKPQRVLKSHLHAMLTKI